MPPSVGLLFTPTRIGALALHNRLVMAPMTRCRSPGHAPNAANVQYYRRRARGGVGLIITEGTCIGHPTANGYPDVPALEGEGALSGWRAVVEAVHEEGARILPQLWHVGSVRQPGMQPDPEVPGVAPSAVLHPTLSQDTGKLPRVLTERDIADLIEAYARAARHARELGFDGVEVHAAHGYLIDQFFWDHTNRRTDRYGGDLIARTRFAVEVLTAIRRAVGAEFPICMRFSQFKLGAYDARLCRSSQELERWLVPLVNAGVDVFHCSQRRFDTPEFEGSLLNLAGWTKKLSGKPTISVGSVGLAGDFIASFDGKEAEPGGIQRLLARLEREEFDLIALGRALLADAEWANKVRAGELSKIQSFRTEHLAQYP